MEETKMDNERDPEALYKEILADLIDPFSWRNFAAEADKAPNGAQLTELVLAALDERARTIASWLGPRLRDDGGQAPDPVPIRGTSTMPFADLFSDGAMPDIKGSK